MARIRIPSALQWALRHGKEAAASTDTIDRVPCIGFLPFSIAIVRKAYHTEQGMRTLPPKPPEIIPWHPFLCNRIDLIGCLMQNVDIQYLNSGHTRGISVLKFAEYERGSTLYIVELWDELAEMAARHTKRGNLLHVGGILHVNDVLDEVSKIKIQWKVTATKLHFIMRSSREAHGLRTNCKSTHENIQEDNEDAGKLSVKNDDLSMNRETAQKITNAVNEYVEKCPMKDDDLRRSIPTIIEAVDAGVKKNSAQDYCTTDLGRVAQKIIQAVDADVEKTSVQESLSMEKASALLEGTTLRSYYNGHSVLRGADTLCAVAEGLCVHRKHSGSRLLEKKLHLCFRGEQTYFSGFSLFEKSQMHYCLESNNFSCLKGSTLVCGSRVSRMKFPTQIINLNLTN